MRVCGLLILMLLALPAAARVELLEGVAFEHERELAGVPLLLSGTHVSRWAGLVKVSVGGLWLPPDARGRDVLDAQVAKQLELHYLASIPGRRLRDGTREILARNWPASTLARHQPGVDAIVGAFGDVKSGDRYTLSYRPGAGVALSLNGRVVARTADDAAGALLFSVWLGAAPLNAEKKRDLLAYRLHGAPGDSR